MGEHRYDVLAARPLLENEIEQLHRAVADRHRSGTYAKLAWRPRARRGHAVPRRNDRAPDRTGCAPHDAADSAAAAPAPPDAVAADRDRGSNAAATRADSDTAGRLHPADSDADALTAASAGLAHPDPDRHPDAGSHGEPDSHGVTDAAPADPEPAAGPESDPDGVTDAVIRVVLLATALALDGPFASNVVKIPVRLNERISSQDANTGDTFTFDTTSSAEVDGEFLPARSHGRGIVVYARAARGPQPGVLKLEAQTLDLPDGKKLDVGLEPGQLDAHIEGDVRSYPGTQPPGGSAFAIGRGPQTNIVYEKGTAFTVVAPPPATPAPEPSAG